MFNVSKVLSINCLIEVTPAGPTVSIHLRTGGFLILTNVFSLSLEHTVGYLSFFLPASERSGSNPSIHSLVADIISCQKATSSCVESIQSTEMP